MRLTVHINKATAPALFRVLSAAWEDAVKLVSFPEETFEELVRQFPEEALVYGNSILTDAQFNECARHDPDIALQHAGKGVLTEDTLQYWKEESPATYGYFLETEHPVCPVCNSELEYSSCWDIFLCSEGCGEKVRVSVVEKQLIDRGVKNIPREDYNKRRC